jgi:multiple sugar transport system substrate-binding protein
MKKIVILLLVLVVVSGMVAAGGGQNAASGKKQLTLYTWWGAAERTMGEALVANFEANHPDIKVEQNHIATEYMSKLNTMVASGNTPDVYFINEVSEWGEKGVGEDLMPFFNKSGVDPRKFYVESALYFTGSHLWGINATCTTVVLYYNKELFRAAGLPFPPDNTKNPWRWDQYVEAAKKLTKDANGRTPNDAGFNPDNIVQYGTVMNIGGSTGWLSWLYSNNARIANRSGTAYEIFSPAAAKVFQSIANLSLVDKVAPSYAIAQSSAFSSTSTALMNNQIAMLTSGTYVLADFTNENYDVGIAEIPIFDKATNIVWSAGFQMKKGGSQEAFELLHHMVDFTKWIKVAKENKIELTGLPQTNAVFDDPAINTEWISIYNKDMVKVSGDILQNAGMIPENVTLKNYAEIVNNTIRPELDKVWIGEETAEQALKNLEAQLTIDKLQGAWE